MPALNAAVAALDTLKQNDISLVKAMANPPNGVKLVMEAVCIMKVSVRYFNKKQYFLHVSWIGLWFIIKFILIFQSIKPDNKVDANGRKVEDYWPAAKRVSGLSLLNISVIK